MSDAQPAMARLVIDSLRQQVATLTDLAMSRARDIAQLEHEVATLTEALEKIKDGPHECGCRHDDPNCCNVIGFFCEFCIASSAIAVARGEQT